MSQVEDIRFKQADHERRIAALEALVNPLASEMKEAASMKVAENLLDDASDQTPADGPKTLDESSTVTSGPASTSSGDSLPPLTLAPKDSGDDAPATTANHQSEEASADSFMETGDASVGKTEPSVSEEVKEEAKDEAH